jgi:hypothetical protein
MSFPDRSAQEISGSGKHAVGETVGTGVVGAGQHSIVLVGVVQSALVAYAYTSQHSKVSNSRFIVTPPEE